ncbi:sugar phosphate isomerase/epimerase [Rhodobacteraceae bacterium CCMM004]|nr:sugar phosphate isomerase/epimerase [Rhodobacteraceae bacterium CCMM004]
MTPGLGSYAFRWSIGHKDRVPSDPMTPLEVLTTAADLGFEVLQYADNMPLHRLEAADLDGLSAAAREAGVALEVGIQTFDADLALRYLEIARRLDARILRVALDAEDAATPLDDLTRSVAAILPQARAADCRIAIENHFDFPSTRMADLLDRVDDPALGACLDVANSICAGEWPDETVAILAPHTINLHLKDYVIRPDPYGAGFAIHGCPLGEGRTDIAGVLAAVGHRPMSVIYEHWLPWPGSFEAARAEEREWTAAGARTLKDALRRQVGA